MLICNLNRHIVVALQKKSARAVAERKKMTYRQIAKVSESISEFFGKITDKTFTYVGIIESVEFIQIPDQDLGFDATPTSTLWTAFAEGISFIVRVKDDHPTSVLIANFNTMETHKIRIKN